MQTAKEEKAGVSKPAGKSRIIAFILLFIATAAVAFAVYMKSQGADFKSLSLKGIFSENPAAQKAAAEGMPVTTIEFNTKGHPDFAVYKDTLIQSGDGSIKGLNKKGGEIWSLEIALAKPVFKSNGSVLLAADIGGKYACVLSGRDIKWSEKLNGNLINADLSESGHVVLVQEAKGSRNIVRVIDPNGVEMFSRSIGENFVVDAKVSPSGEQLVIDSLDVSGVEINPSLEFFDMMGNPFAAKIPEPGTVFPQVLYLGDDSLLAASDSTLVYYDRDRSEKWRKSFDRIYSMGVLSGKYIAAAVKSSSKAPDVKGLSTVEIINTKGQTVASYTLEDEVKNIRTFNDIAAINTGREVHFINSKGKPAGKYSSKSDIDEVYFFNRLEAAVITRTSIAIVKIG